MSHPISLIEYAVQLAHAAGAGAKGIASSVIASGNVQAKTGLEIEVPGPALRSILERPGARTRTTDTAPAGADTLVPKIADRLANSALRQGADLLSDDG